MELVFIQENHGIGKTSQKPYHFIKLADPRTFENHTVSIDSSTLQAPLNLQHGQLYKLEGRLSTPFNTTQFLCTSIKPVQKAN